MDLKLFSSGSTTDNECSNCNIKKQLNTIIRTNPNPKNFKIKFVKYFKESNYTVAYVHYKDATSMEGNKLILFIGDMTDMLKKVTYLDPHFDYNSAIVARFKPDITGIQCLFKTLGMDSQDLISFIFHEGKI